MQHSLLSLTLPPVPIKQVQGVLSGILRATGNGDGKPHLFDSLSPGVAVPLSGAKAPWGGHLRLGEDFRVRLQGANLAPGPFGARLWTSCSTTRVLSMGMALDKSRTLGWGGCWKYQRFDQSLVQLRIGLGSNLWTIGVNVTVVSAPCAACAHKFHVH